MKTNSSQSGAVEQLRTQKIKLHIFVVAGVFFPVFKQKTTSFFTLFQGQIKNASHESLALRGDTQMKTVSWGVPGLPGEPHARHNYPEEGQCCRVYTGFLLKVSNP